MKRLIFIPLWILGFLLTSCMAQSKQENAKDEPALKPKSNITVNKQYDQDGNLVRYDSTYSYYYSNIAGDTLMSDSIMNQFRHYFNKSYFFSEDPFFSDFYFNDSLMPDNFFNDDFFTGRFRQNMQQMDALFQGMDSIKNEFFRQLPNAMNSPGK